jgi:Terminase large subunit, T4likevirus-type, N-terminal
VNQRVSIGFSPQPGPQVAFLHSPCDITVYGGARGGGKTYAALGDFFIHAEDYGVAARGMMVRRTREDLKDTHATALEMYGNAAKWHEKGSFFEFHTGARLYFAYLESERDAMAYQGWSLTRVYVEELTTFDTDMPVLRMLATLRSSSGVPCQMKATCNPGGPGHSWVKQWVIDLGPYNAAIDPETRLSRVFIPAKLADNPLLTLNDPTYINRLRSVGSDELVRAWLEGDWNVVEGAFFSEFTRARHVIQPFPLPETWTLFRSMDWGSASPFAVHWWGLVQNPFKHDGRMIPRGALVCFNEWYGASKPNIGLKLTVPVVAEGIVAREKTVKGRLDIRYGVLDPSAFAVVAGPSIAETFARCGVPWRRADNARVSTAKKMGGWAELRSRLKGNAEGEPTIFFFDHCRDIIRTLPLLQHDPIHPEDVDTDLEDHAADSVRYAVMSRARPAQQIVFADRNPLLVRNAFKLDELRD